MPDPVTIRLLGLPGGAWLWGLSIVALALFGRRIGRIVAFLRRARPENRWDRIPRRTGLAAQNVLLQRRLLQEPVFGVAHLLIFWTFVFFATGFLWNLLRGLVPALPIPYADEVPWMVLPLEVLAVVALAALAGAALRRYAFTPAGMERTWDATLVLGLITLLMLTFLAGQGFRAVGEGHGSAGSPVSTFLGGRFAAWGLRTGAATSLALGMWWLHMALVLGFLAYLPYSKHGHLLFSPFSVFFTALEPGGMPPESEGAARTRDFTWRQLFNALACAECGRCERACPAHQSGSPLSPKQVIHKLKRVVHEAVAAPRVPSDAEADGPGLVGEVFAPEEIWACTTCLACTARCPVFNEHVPLLTEMRRHLVTEGAVDERVQDVLVHLTRYGNSFGKSPRGRARWTRDLDFRIKDARREAVEYLWIVGDYASFDPRVQPVTRVAARLLRRAGLDFGILYEAEQNSGNDVRRLGEEGLFGLLRDKNRRALGQATFERIVTTDPHTYHALRHEYWNGNGQAGSRPAVLHLAQVLETLLGAGRLRVATPLRTRVAYHDPCYLGRYGGVYAAPRRVLRALGASVVEMPRRRGGAYCCGAGGGRIWMEDAPGVRERPAESRVREAAALPGVDTLVVCCPKDLVMFQDAVKSANLEDALVVKDITELVESALSPEVRSDSHAEAHAER